MRTKHYFTVVLFVSLNIAFSQTNNKFVIKVNTDKTFKLPSGEKKADFTKPIILSFTGKTVPANLTFKCDEAEQSSHKKNDYSFEVKENQKDPINFEITATGYTKTILSIEGINIKEDHENKKNDQGENIDKSNSYEHYYQEFAKKTDTYNRDENTAYYYFDEKGLLLSLAPVNVDADDYLVVYMIVPKENNTKTIQVIGEYNASDLNIRPYEATIPGAQSGKKTTTEYTVMTTTFGPFTSNKVKIKFFDGTTEMTNSLDVRINKLYNVAIGASFISTELEKPEFDIFPIAGTTNNTINTINSGKRTLATFNVIFYWKASVDWISGKLKGKSNITRGRDILKEATFWERLNPTFGVAINSEWRQNFFFGGNFEFTRGASISAGWHYGKVQKLADSNFKLGKDIFTGTKEDIKLMDTWQTGFFFGITLDTRIFNKIVSRN